MVDNDSSDGTSDAVRELAPAANVIEAGSNLGFAAGCNLGAREASTALLLFLNPDAIPLEGFRDAIELPLAEGRGWAAWQGLVTAEGGSVINTRGGVVHFTGIAWAGGAGEPLDAEGPMARPASDRERRRQGASSLSRASSPAPAWRFRAPSSIGSAASPRTTSSTTRTSTSRCGPPRRRAARRRGGGARRSRLRLCERAGQVATPGAQPLGDHHPYLPGGAARARAPRRCCATELALVPISIAGGWFGSKLGAWCDLARSAARLAGARAGSRRRGRIGAGEFAAALTADLDSAYLGAAAESRPLRASLRAYWSVVLALLGGGRGRPARG